MFEARETEVMPLMKLSPVALEIDRREFTNRVNYDAVCTYQVSGTTAHRPTRARILHVSSSPPY